MVTRTYVRIEATAPIGQPELIHRQSCSDASDFSDGRVLWFSDRREETGSNTGFAGRTCRHRQRLPAAQQAWLSLDVRVQLRRVRVGAARADDCRTGCGAGRDNSQALATTAPVQLAGVGAVLVGTAR